MEDGSPSDESTRVRWPSPFVGRPNTGFQATGRGSGSLSVPLLSRPAPEAWPLGGTLMPMIDVQMMKCAGYRAIRMSVKQIDWV